jgi:hypothetical protein
MVNSNRSCLADRCRETVKFLGDALEDLARHDQDGVGSPLTAEEWRAAFKRLKGGLQETTGVLTDAMMQLEQDDRELSNHGGSAGKNRVAVETREGTLGKEKGKGL